MEAHQDILEGTIMNQASVNKTSNRSIGLDHMTDKLAKLVCIPCKAHFNV